MPCQLQFGCAIITHIAKTHIGEGMGMRSHHLQPSIYWQYSYIYRRVSKNVVCFYLSQ